MAAHDLAPRRKRLRVWRALLVTLFALLCFGSIGIVVLGDQTALAGMAYLGAVNSGNTGIVALMGDHYTESSGWHQRFLAQDARRDAAWLNGAEVSDVTTSREQTLSGQWVTMVRFRWRKAGTSAQWTQAALRVKTDRWLFIPYVRVVEDIGP